ncbi:trigger factor [Vallitaleaceae bacterium 9-2]
MSTKVEKLENSMVKLTIEVSADIFEKGLNHAYNKNKKSIQIPGFRKGKAPRKLIEKTYGIGVFYEDAANYCIPEAYDKAVEEEGLEVVSRPEIDVEQIEAGKPFIFTAEVAVKPEVTLGDYKGLEATKDAVEVTDEEVDNDIDNVREQNSRLVDVTDRAITMDDQVNIDFDGYVDGEPFEGGKAEGYDLTIGSGSFIDTFEEQLVGKNVDDELEVEVTFPEEYHVDDLKGKPATFKVKINGIKVKELPELDDELAKDVSEFDTLDEYKASVKEKLAESKENAATAKLREEVLEKAVENASIELPEPMVELEAENMTYDMAQRLQYQGLSIEQYFQYTGQNMETLKASMKPEAEKKIKARLVLEAIAVAENIEATDEDVEAEIARMAEMYNMEVEKIKETIGDDEKDSIKQDLVNQKAYDLIVENAKVN